MATFPTVVTETYTVWFYFTTRLDLGQIASNSLSGSGPQWSIFISVISSKNVQKLNSSYVDSPLFDKNELIRKTENFPTGKVYI